MPLDKQEELVKDKEFYHSFYENADLPMTVFTVSEGKIEPVKVLEYGLSDSSCTIATLLCKDSRGAHRTSVDMYHLSESDALKELADIAASNDKGGSDDSREAGRVQRKVWATPFEHEQIKAMLDKVRSVNK